MRLRKLQRRDESKVWFDDAYAYEAESGRVVFRYNLAWGRIGSYYNGKIREADTPLEDIETIIPPTEDLHWLPIEVIADEAIDTYFAELDKACAASTIPHPRSVAKSVSVNV